VATRAEATPAPAPANPPAAPNQALCTRETKGGPAVFHEGRAPSTSDVAVAGRVEVKAAPAARAAAQATGAGKPALPVQTGDAAPQAGGKELVAPVGDAAPNVAAAGKEPGARSGLGSGVMRAAGARLDWASLLKRVFLEVVLACPCGGRRRILADVEEPSAIVAILRHLGLPTEALPLARARDPAVMAFGFA
jgi:hypothetical protein